MTRKPARGLFITGTDTGVGKTYVGALVARALVAAGYRVGLYKPVASGALRMAGELISEDALALWTAAGSPGNLAEVCPQVFEATLAPHLAAEAEGKLIDPVLLRSGIQVWLERSDVVIVEGAGGLMSPVSEDEYVADLAYDFGFPLVVVASNRLGVVNQVLQTLVTAATFRQGLPIAGLVMNHRLSLDAGGELIEDASVEFNADEIRRRAVAPLLAEVGWRSDRFSREVDWFATATEAIDRTSERSRNDD